jgi:undecaprenyl-diphosphatase
VRNRPRKSAFSPYQAVTLGLLQGPTELLPISSSAHTALLPWLAGWRHGKIDPELRKSFQVALHAGAAVALAIDMRRELIDELRDISPRRGAVIALSLAPPALAGLAFQRPIERRLGGPRSIAAGLIAGAAAMALADARSAGKNRRMKDAGPADGLALGVAQALALIPGVSRNGATLTAARARGFARPEAQALSWHAALPVILGASALKGSLLLGSRAPEGARRTLATGAASAFVSTLASAPLLRRVSRDRPLLPYCAYRLALALLVLRRLRSADNGEE